MKETYESVIGVYNLERDDIKMWEMVWNHEIQSLFQMTEQSGVQGIALTKPKSVDELATLNSLIRLMAPDKNSEQPLNKYARFKQDKKLWQKEMDLYGLSKADKETLEELVGQDYGFAPTQESFMKIVQDPRCGGFDLNFADRLRKSIAKKAPADFLKLEEEYFTTIKEKGLSENLCNYVWKVLVSMSRGYGFNASHTLAYSIVGLQEMNLAFKYPIIFWNCACLIANSGGDVSDEEDEDTSGKDYNKIAKALGKTIESGIKVSTPNINKSLYTFSPDVENNVILYGLSGITGIGEEIAKKIIDNRPYESIAHFVSKVPVNRSQVVSLIKAGCFDDFGQSRERIMVEYIWDTCNKKSRINLQNYLTLVKKGLIPDREDLVRAKRIYEFNRYLKNECRKDYDFIIDERGKNFIIEYELPVEESVKVKDWEKIYNKEMDIMRDWMNSNKDEILKELNMQIFMEDWEKYAKGNISSWEMESLCFYYHDHELKNVNASKYGLVNFFDLSEDPIVEKVFKKGQSNIPIYKLYKICGTCIAKNKAKGTVSLLTTDGVVSVKFGKEYFAMFDKQISAQNEDGSKRVIEKSWFNRGNMIVVQGMRRGEEFVSKNYKSTGGHQLYHIDQIMDNGDLVLRSEREVQE